MEARRPSQAGAGEVRIRSGTLRNLSSLPPFHPTALRLLTVSIDSDSAMPAFEDAFSCDPALAADLLVLANSAEFGLRSHIETIRHALVVLGLERVRSLAFSLAMRSYCVASPRRQELQSVWSHSIATAIISEQLAGPAGSDTRLLYTAGLTHDIGRLGMILGVGRQYTETLHSQVSGMEEALAREKRAFGMSHCEAGLVLARKWNLPASLRTCISQHHETVTPGTGGLLRLIQMACRMADSLSFCEVPQSTPDSGAAPGFQLPEALRGRPELAGERLTEMITRQISAVWKLDS